MCFIVDAQLPPALALRLVAEGHEAEHVRNRQMQAASDSEIWNYARKAAAIIVTKDDDFAQRRFMTRAGPVVIWIRLPNTRRVLLAWFEVILPDVLLAIERGKQLIGLL